MTEHGEHLTNAFEQWQAEEIGYEDEPSSHHYQMAVQNKTDAHERLITNATEQRTTGEALDHYREQIEQTCVELESPEEYLRLFDDLRFDLSISHTRHDFLNELYLFTERHFHGDD